MGTDYTAVTECLVPVLKLLKAELRAMDVKSPTAPKKAKTAKKTTPAAPAPVVDSGELSKLIEVCKKWRKTFPTDAALADIGRVGEAVFGRFSIPVNIQFIATGKKRDVSGSNYTVMEATAAKAKEKLASWAPPEVVLEKVSIDYCFVATDFIHPDAPYDDFYGEREIYYRFPAEALWKSKDKPKQALLDLCKHLKIKPESLAPTTWVSIWY